MLEERKHSWSDAMELAARSDMLNLPGKPPPHGATHINRKGLIKMQELASKKLELMGQAVFKMNTVSM